jgi:hypothetical protein
MLIPTLVLAVLCLSVTQVQAASATSLLFPDVVTKLEDDDWESMIDVRQNGILDDGDFLFGMLVIQYGQEAGTSNTKWPTYDTFTGEFVAKVQSVVWTGSQWKYVLVPATAAEWAAINTATGYDLELPMAADSFGTIYSDRRPNLTTPWVDPFAASVTAALDTADTNVTTPIWDWGFAGKSDEHWTAYANQQNFSPTLQVTTYISTNVTWSYPGSVPLLYHNYLGGLGYTQYTGPVQLQGYGVLEASSAGVFALKTDTDFYVKPTPEPGSLALLGLGLVACAGMVYRRRKNNA